MTIHGAADVAWGELVHAVWRTRGEKARSGRNVASSADPWRTMRQKEGKEPAREAEEKECCRNGNVGEAVESTKGAPYSPSSRALDKRSRPRYQQSLLASARQGRGQAKRRRGLVEPSAGEKAAQIRGQTY